MNCDTPLTLWRVTSNRENTMIGIGRVTAWHGGGWKGEIE